MGPPLIGSCVPWLGLGPARSFLMALSDAQRRERDRQSKFKQRYGITWGEYLRMFKSRDGKCDICGKKCKKAGGRGRKTSGSHSGVIHVDHCHETGKVRGMLCGPCNQGLGKLGDNIAGLERALDYLKKKGPNP